MNNLASTPVRECIEILKDRKWHDVYELHENYHLNALEIFDAIEILLKKNIIDKSGFKIKLADAMSNEIFAIVNQIQKTKRPSSLDHFVPRHLTRDINRV